MESSVHDSSEAVVDSNDAHGEYLILRDLFLRADLPFQLGFNGTMRMSTDALVLPDKFVQRLYACAESFVRSIDELCAYVAEHPDLLESVFGFDARQIAMWNLAGLQWAGLARADVFSDADGTLSVVELNSDTPSGIDEALVLDAWMTERFAGLRALNDQLAERWLRAVLGELPNTALNVALVYPTDLPEDLGLLEIFRRWLESRHCTVYYCSPHQLRLDEEEFCCLGDTRINLIVRHYKTDWWFAARNVWKNENSIENETDTTLQNSEDLHAPLSVVAHALAASKLRVVNSFATLLTQNKLCMALLHELKEHFSVQSREFIEAHLPFSVRCTTQLCNQLGAEKDRWVLKSEYGCEGAETIVGAECSNEEWERCLKLIVPERWIAQEYKHFERDEDGCQTNYGVYLVEGVASGLYVRRSTVATSNAALVQPAVRRRTLDRTAEQHRTEFEAARNSQSNHHELISHTHDTAAAEARARCYRALDPGYPWSLFYAPTVLYSQQAPHHTESRLVIQADQRARVLGLVKLAQHIASTIASSHRLSEQYPAEPRVDAEVKSGSTFFFVIDLSISELVAFMQECLESANSQVRFVFQCNTMAHEGGCCELDGLNEELYRLADRKADAKQPHSKENPVRCLLLDAQRLNKAHVVSPEQFNNCWLAAVPGVNFLQQQGIENVVYVSKDGAESDDVLEDMLLWMNAGIDVTCLSLSEVEELASLYVSQFPQPPEPVQSEPPSGSDFLESLRTKGRVPSVRRTMFQV